VDIQWTDQDPETGERRFVCADRFAREWRFKVRHRRREDWDENCKVTLEMWETLLDAMERRHQRREGIEDFELKMIRKIIANWKPEPHVETTEPQA
jgi:hypothetical protein